METKYVGTTHAAKELIWFHHLISKIFWPLIYPIVLHLDNQSAIALANSEGQFHTHMKHIDICYYFIKVLCTNGSFP